MAGTTVLLRRLDSDEEPLAKRLCIAQNVFQSSQLPIQRKEEAVINWFCKVAGKYRKKKKRDSVVGSGDDVLKLWSSLQTCVSSPHMQRLGVSDIRPSAKANLVKAISKHLERDLLPADHIAVLECAVALLEASSFQRYFRTNIPLCFNFVSLMLGSMSHLNSEHITLCVRCVSTIQAISRQTILRNDLCLTFLNVVLLPLITLLKSQGSQPSPLTIEIYKCIQQVLFPKASSDLPNFLNAIFKETKKVADPTANLPISEDQHQIAFRLLEVLREAKNVLAEDLFVSLIGTVFRAFVASQKSNSGPLIFKMTVVLSYLVGFHVKNTKCKALYVKLSESVAKAEKDLSLLSLNTFHAMVVIMAQWKIPLNGETCGLSFLNWLQMAVESLFPCPSHLSVGSSFLELMSILIKLNPLIVEPNVKNILVSITAKPLAVEEESFYSTFVSNLVGMYMKLNRIPNFTSILLTSLHDGFKKQHESNTLIMNQHAWLPSTVMEQLTQFATTMPSTSSISTLTILLDQFSNFGIQPHLQSLEKEFSNSRFIDLFLQCVCELFCSFLSGVRLLEQCTIFPARQGYCAFLKLLTEHLRSFGHLLLKAKTSNPAMLSTFLKMSYHWAAEALLIQQYADVGREELLASVETCLNEGTKSISGGGALSYLHSYLTCDEWNIIYNMAAQSNDENCKELLLNLDLQLLSAIRMFDASQSSNAKEVAKRASELLVQKLCSAKTEKLNRSTVLDIILISPLLTISDLVTLSDSIAICLIGCKNENSVSTLTSLLVEERLVACGLICSTLTSLKRCLKVSKRKKDENRGKLWMISKSVMGSLNSEMIIRAEIQNQPSSNEELELIISSIANTVEKSLVDLNEIHLIKEEYDFSDVSAHLQLLRLLPLAYLSPSHQAVLFISLLGVALDCNSLPSSPSKVEILKQIFDHLLLGLYERGMRVSPNFAGHLDYGVLISGLAHFVTYHNVGRRLLELVLGHALRHEQTQGQVLDKVALLKKKGKTNEPGKENLLVGSMLMQNLCEKKLKNVRSTKIPESVEESTSDPVEVLKRARNKLAKTFETLIEGNLVNPQEALHAFALTLDFNIKFGKGIDSIVKHLHNFTSAAVSFLVSNELSEQKAAETLLLVVFRNRNKLNEAMPKSLLKDVWLILSSFVNPSEVLVTAVFESASQDEMSFIADDLLQKTGKHTTIVTHAPLEEKPISNAMQFWLVLLKCHNLPAANNEVCIKAVRTLFERLPHLNIQQKQLLEFLRAVLSSSKVAMDMEMIDQCLSILHGVILPQTVKEFIPIATQYSSVLSALLLHRSSHTLDCIPSFLQLLQYFVKQLANQSKQTSDLSRSDGAQLAGVAFGVEKLLFALTKPERKKSFQRVAAYFLADIMTIFETITLCSAVKVHFQNMSYALISIIDDHAVKFLLRTMSSASNEIFKTLLDSYKKFHRFSGKV